MDAIKLSRILDANLNNGLRRLVWFPDLGLGYYPVDRSNYPYDAAYFAKYEAYAETQLGHDLTNARSELVRWCWMDDLLDVGIGCGQFIRDGVATHGFDINPTAVTWLKKRGVWRSPYVDPVDAASCWDTLEHMADPLTFLNTVKKVLFVSLPIFENAEHAMESKHFRPTEHYWYWTLDGFVNFMSEAGFSCSHQSDIETMLGREDIKSFIFQRYR